MKTITTIKIEEKFKARNHLVVLMRQHLKSGIHITSRKTARQAAKSQLKKDLDNY